MMDKTKFKNIILSIDSVEYKLLGVQQIDFISSRDSNRHSFFTGEEETYEHAMKLHPSLPGIFKCRIIGLFQNNLDLLLDLFSVMSFPDNSIFCKFEFCDDVLHVMGFNGVVVYTKIGQKQDDCCYELHIAHNAPFTMDSSENN